MNQLSHQAHPSQHQLIKENPLRAKMAWGLLALIFLLITALYAYLMLKDTLPILGLLLLPASWLLFAILSGRLSDRSPLNLPIILLFALLPLSYYISVDKLLTLPKLYSLVLSIALFFVILNTIRSKKSILLALLGLLALIMGVLLIGLVGVDWSANAFPGLSILTSRIPCLCELMPGLFSGPVVNVNTIGGALTFFSPLLLSLILDEGAFGIAFIHGYDRRQRLNVVYKIGLVILLLITLFILLLTQSRGAWLGSMLGLFVVFVAKHRQFLWLIPLLLVLVILAFFTFGEGNIETFLTMIDTDPENATLAGRFRAWQATLYMIADFPLTGVGLGTYSRVFTDLYALNAFLSATTPSLHAHNTLLSVTVDLGFPGLILYVALLTSFFAVIFHTTRSAHPFIRVLLLGLGAGMLAHQVFGLTDAYLLGTKLGIIMWIYYGLAAALFTHRHHFAFRRYHNKYPLSALPSQPAADSYLAAQQISGADNDPNAFPDKQNTPGTSKKTGFLLIALSQLFIFLLTALAVLALVNINIFLAMVIAILAGISIAMIPGIALEKKTK